MANASLLDTKTVNLNDVIGNGKIYRVPPFQRDYSWAQDNWEDLWNDIINVKSSGKPHYMGSVVLQNDGSKNFLIIDGQQRFTTLSVLALAFISKVQKLADDGIEPSENQERVQILMRQYIGQKDPSSLRYSSKLFLNENNDAFYQQRLLAFRTPINLNKLSDSDRLMWDAFQFFQHNLDKNFDTSSGSQLAQDLNSIIGELLMFIQITVEDELDAYTVFETLNSRGLELTSTDLLKNYLFSLVAKSPSDLQMIKVQWGKIIDSVGLKEFPAFLRYYLQATKEMITKEYLFKAIKKFVKTGEHVFDLLDHLESYAYTYIALGAPDDELWAGDKEIRGCLNALKLFRVTQWKPVAMVAFERLSNVEFKRVLQSIVVISYRYNVIARFQTNDMEKVYSRVAVTLFNNKQPTASAAINDLKAIYVDDEDFKSFFQLKQFKTGNSNDKKQLRYTLYKLEAQEAGGAAYDYEGDDGTVEHILPESYPENWHSSFSEDEYNRNIYMLGNLTILEPSKNNKHAADHDFDVKKGVYITSKYVITKNLTQNDWTPNTVKSRQAHLARIASTVWKL